MHYFAIYLNVAAIILALQILKLKELTTNVRRFYNEVIVLNSIDRETVTTSTPAFLILCMISYSLVPGLNLFIVWTLITGTYNKMIGSAVIQTALEGKSWKHRQAEQ